MLTIINFLKKFSSITSVLNWVKGFFSPLTIVVIIVFSLLLGGNYFFYKRVQAQEIALLEKEKKYQDLNTSFIGLQADYLQRIHDFQTKKQEFQTTLKELSTLHQKQIKEAQRNAKQKEKNTYLEDGTIAPVLRNTLDGLFQETNNTDATTR